MELEPVQNKWHMRPEKFTLTKGWYTDASSYIWMTYVTDHTSSICCVLSIWLWNICESLATESVLTSPLAQNFLCFRNLVCYNVVKVTRIDISNQHLKLCERLFWWFFCEKISRHQFCVDHTSGLLKACDKVMNAVVLNINMFWMTILCWFLRDTYWCVSVSEYTERRK